MRAAFVGQWPAVLGGQMEEEAKQEEEKQNEDVAMQQEEKKEVDEEKKEGQEEEAAAEEEEEEEPQVRLAESTLWKEDVYVNGHRSVWGSLYDPEAKRWGYACCPGCARDQPCQVEEAEKAAVEADRLKEAGDSGIDQTSSDSEKRDINQKEDKELDWKDPPTVLRPRAEFKCPRLYIEHFVRYYMNQWQELIDGGLVGFTDMQRIAFQKSAFPECRKAVTPLLRRLRRRENLDRGETKNKTRSRETRTSMEGKHVQEQNVLQSLDRMATCASEREYAIAHETYVKLTFGNKMWNLTHVAHVAACTMKGAREYRRNRDSLNTYDMDPVSQKYMHAIKKLCFLAQCMTPNDDHSKNVVM